MSHVHFPLPQVYHQERVEEVRTEQRSSGGGKMASLNNNLSELDTLLQDLNNARYTGVFKGKDFFYCPPFFVGSFTFSVLCLFGLVFCGGD